MIHADLLIKLFTIANILRRKNRFYVSVTTTPFGIARMSTDQCLLLFASVHKYFTFVETIIIIAEPQHSNCPAGHTFYLAACVFCFCFCSLRVILYYIIYFGWTLINSPSVLSVFSLLSFYQLISR